jgi:hypothetical protein
MKYLIPNVFIGLYVLFYVIKYKFTFKVVERIFMIVQDGLIIATLDIMVFNFQYILDYHIDFYALAIVLAIEIIEVFIKFIMFCKKGSDDDDEEAAVSPEKEGREKERINNSFGESVDQINPEYTYNGLQGNNSGVSSGRGGGVANNNRRAPPRRR